MTEDKVITLPNREEMEKRLLAVDDNSRLAERFYPLLVKHAGQERVATGVVMMFTLAIHDYTEGMPTMMAALLHWRIDKYIDALVDDKEVAEEAKQHFVEVRAEAKNDPGTEALEEDASPGFERQQIVWQDLRGMVEAILKSSKIKIGVDTKIGDYEFNFWCEIPRLSIKHPNGDYTSLTFLADLGNKQYDLDQFKSIRYESKEGLWELRLNCIKLYLQRRIGDDYPKFEYEWIGAYNKAEDSGIASFFRVDLSSKTFVNYRYGKCNMKRGDEELLKDMPEELTDGQDLLGHKVILRLPVAFTEKMQEIIEMTEIRKITALLSDEQSNGDVINPANDGYVEN
ncbi:MAG: hypothetical protein UT66_C0023G0001 [candidate division CPR2 bacterium GW2011_GWC1_39_9]|uniref:Uncharacterized protein n=1 Tax=candidate division CPR2 bacterium GW2011_GWC2_39_10 TaxID=1618345 RepID=A0A0G0LQ52_UNCC2|nr:MAG: hypothetical protein UT18_C0025G0009 [candidate division CPR2 bacterium GW2011_GWC2_39_10]KKR34478.1 MAG: hypothetical protein UT66_C0023G0001 [candidate division CPR2 bacterium GW2011_GWC1_39_9]